MEIRSYKDEDFPQMENLLKNSGLYSKELTKRENFKKKIEYDPESIIVAEDKGIVVGIHIFIYDPWSSYTWDTVVHENYRNKGIATQMIQMADKILKSRGKDVVRGFVSENKPDILEFWKKRGFVYLSKVIYVTKKIK